MVLGALATLSNPAGLRGIEGEKALCFQGMSGTAYATT
jgi:hypothetical protein